MDVRSVKKYQEAIVDQIVRLQWQMNNFNKETQDAVAAYNKYTQSVDLIASKHYKRNPLPLTSANFENVDLSQVVNIAKNVPPAQATS
jgi:trans-2-enoyl-CoA reductase